MSWHGSQETPQWPRPKGALEWYYQVVFFTLALHTIDYTLTVCGALAPTRYRRRKNLMIKNHPRLKI
jgi:hypothetical protein